MDEYKRRRRRSRAVMSMFLDSLGGSIDNVDVAEFDSDGSDLKALVVGIDPVQDLHGYDYPWPAGGGKNKFNPDSTDKKWIGSDMSVSYPSGTKAVEIPATEGQTWTASMSNARTATNLLIVVFFDANNNLLSRKLVSAGAKVVTGIAPANTASVLCSAYTYSQAGDVQLELGSSATAFAPYSNICPISGHTSVNVIVSPTLNPLDGTITNIPLGGTYYGGQLDVLTGVLTVTHANISSYNGEAINEPWISSMDAYSPGATPTTGAQVVYELATPQTIQLTGQQIATFIGTNHVWCDSGKIIHLEY